MGYTLTLDVHEVLKGNANVWLQNYVHNFQEQQRNRKIIIIIIITFTNYWNKNWTPDEFW